MLRVRGVLQTAECGGPAPPEEDRNNAMWKTLNRRLSSHKPRGIGTDGRPAPTASKGCWDGVEGRLCSCCSLSGRTVLSVPKFEIPNLRVMLCSLGGMDALRILALGVAAQRPKHTIADLQALLPPTAQHTPSQQLQPELVATQTTVKPGS